MLMSGDNFSIIFVLNYYLCCIYLLLMMVTPHFITVCSSFVLAHCSVLFFWLLCVRVRTAPCGMNKVWLNWIEFFQLILNIFGYNFFFFFLGGGIINLSFNNNNNNKSSILTLTLPFFHHKNHEPTYFLLALAPTLFAPHLHWLH